MLARGVECTESVHNCLGSLRTTRHAARTVGNDEQMSIGKWERRCSVLPSHPGGLNSNRKLHEGSCVWLTYISPTCRHSNNMRARGLRGLKLAQGKRKRQSLVGEPW